MRPSSLSRLMNRLSFLAILACLGLTGCYTAGGSGVSGQSSLAPTVLAPPQSQTVALGAGATFTVTGSGTPLPSYQWQRSNDGGTTWTTIAGATGTSYALDSTATPDNQAQFRVLLTDPAGTATSASATLTVTATLGTSQTVAALAPNSVPTGICTGPDGNLWFTNSGNGQIGKMDALTHQVSLVSLPNAACTPVGITTGPDGNLWFTEQTAGSLGAVSTAGVLLHEFSVGRGPTGIVTGSDGNLWTTLSVGNQIARMTPAGAATVYALPTAGARPSGITRAADGTVWFTEQGVGQIGQISPAGAVSEFSAPLPAGGLTPVPVGITTTTDGAVWFSDTANQCITKFTVGTSAAAPARVGLTGLSFLRPEADLSVLSTAFYPLAAGSNPSTLMTDASGNVWGNLSGSSQVVEITVSTASGTTPTTYTLPATTGVPAGLVQGTDGNVYVTGTDSVSQVVATVPTNTVAVIVLVPSPTMVGGGTQTLQAVVTGAANSSVTWSVQAPADGSSGGTITADTGTYVAPTTSGTYTIQATSQTTPPVVGTATVTVYEPAISAITPADATVPGGGSQTFSATITNLPNTSIYWSASDGTMNARTGAWTAPNTAETVTITATSNYATSLSATTQVTITTTPAGIGTQPASQTVNVGSPAKFTVVATGAPQPAYQWQVSTDGGKTWTPLTTGGTAATCTITSVTAAMDGYLYQVTVDNGVGSAVSNTAKLTVTYAPVITTQPAGQTVTLGNPATFQVVAAGDPAPTYQWQVYPSGGSAWSDIAGASSATYVTGTTQTSDSGSLFRVKVTNATGSVFSDGKAGLAVANAPSTPVITAPAVLAPTSVATATVAPQANCTYVWTASGGAITSGAGTASIQFSSAPGVSSGTITLGCTVTNAAGTSAAAAPVQVTVATAPSTPTIYLALSYAAAGQGGYTATAPAQANCTLSWNIVNGAVAVSADGTTATFSAAAPGTLTLTCTATNGAGFYATSAPASLTVLATPAAPVISGAPGTISAGSTGLTASATQPAGCALAWSIAGGTLTSDGTAPAVTFTAGAPGTLTLNCTATNLAGVSTAAAPVTVTVTPPAAPSITAPAQVAMNTGGYTASVPYLASRSVVWSITGGTLTAGANTSSVTFTAGAVGVLTLTCTVTNADGTVAASTVDLTVYAPAPVADLLAPAYALNAGTAQASVSVQPSCTYAWTLTPADASPAILSGATGPVLSYSTGLAAGSYSLSVVVTSTAGGGSATATGTFQVVANQFLRDPGSPMQRAAGTTTVLADGRVLSAGGYNGDFNVVATAELFDPASQTWVTVPPMNYARQGHTATLLPSGAVLVAGGMDGYNNSVGAAEVFTPATQTWTLVGTMAYPRDSHTATLLANGVVLLAGGETTTDGGDTSNTLATAELFNPNSATPWSLAGAMATPRQNHGAALLPNGKVLVAGGGELIAPMNSCELFDPGTGSWGPAAPMAAARFAPGTFLLNSGSVLVAGGNGLVPNPDDGGATSIPGALASAEEYLPDANQGSWSAAGPMANPRCYPSLAPLPGGKVLAAGGLVFNADDSLSFVSATEQFDPGLNQWTGTGSLAIGTGTNLLAPLPDGRVLAAGGLAAFDPFNILSSPQFYDPSTQTWSSPALTVPTALHTTTLLADGRLLVAGGMGFDGTPLALAWLYTPATHTWSPTGSLATARFAHTANLLPSGKVLVTGGDDGDQSLGTAELFDPTTGTWSPAGTLATAREEHTATLLADGRVLVVGGRSNGDPIPTVELYIPEAGTWSPLPSLCEARSDATATLLADGTVLLAGGIGSDGNFLASTERYDGTWHRASSLPYPWAYQTAIPMGDGRVMLVGGMNVSGNGGGGGGGGDAHGGGLQPLIDTPAVTAAAVIYTPGECGSWSLAGSMSTARQMHAATLLPNGQVLVVGGINADNTTPAAVDVYDPTQPGWSSPTSLAGARVNATATLLPGGQVVVVGGQMYYEAYAGNNYVPEFYGPAAAAAGPPAAPTLAAPAEVVLGVAYQASVPAQLGCIYQWSIVGGTPTGGSTATTFGFVPTSGTQVQLSCTVTNPSTQSNTGTATCTIVTPPVTPVITTSTSSAAPGATGLTASVDCAEGYAYTWSISGGTFTSGVNRRNVTFTAGTAGTLTLNCTLTQAALGVSVAAQPASITVVTAPDTTVTVSAASVTSGTPLTASVTSTAGCTYAWTVTGGTLTAGAGTPSITVTAGAAGTLTASVQVTLTAYGASFTGSNTATVIAAPVADLLAPPNAFGGSAHVQASVMYQDGMTYAWTLNGNAQSQLYNVLSYPTPLATGTYSVGVTVTNGLGVTATATLPSLGIVSNTFLKDPGSLAPRFGHTSTTLADGRVLVAGGIYTDGYLNTCEIYDPATRLWVPVGSMGMPRYGHTATLLASGKVLVTGGMSDDTTVLGTAEVFDPSTKAWTPLTSSPMTSARVLHTATLLPSGQVLLAGGVNATGNPTPLNTSERFVPGTGTFVATAGNGSYTAAMGTNRAYFPAILTATGQVMVVGGQSGESVTGAVEVYDPTNDGWTPAGNLNTARSQATATVLKDGRILVVGGTDGSDTLGSTEIYSGSAWSAGPDLVYPRENHTATLLPTTGQVLVAGGYESQAYGWVVTEAEVFTPAYDSYPDQFYEGTSMRLGRQGHTANLLLDGTVLLAGGADIYLHALGAPEFFQPSDSIWSMAGCPGGVRYLHTTTTLADGRLLVAGGMDDGGNALADSWLYDPADGSWGSVGPLNYPSSSHTATLLPNGRVVKFGGNESAAVGADAEVFDPVTQQWLDLASPMVHPRTGHTATLLPTGKIMVVGGVDDTGFALSSTEVYDPKLNVWSSGGNLTSGRTAHTATLVQNKVVVTGGYDASNIVLASVESYDGSTWSVTGALDQGRQGHTATLMDNGLLLLVGGAVTSSLTPGDFGTPTASTTVATNLAGTLWSASVPMNNVRVRHAATNLTGLGQVLVTGGTDGTAALNSAEVFNGSTWSTLPMNFYRSYHTANLLSSGQVMVFGSPTGYVAEAYGAAAPSGEPPTPVLVAPGYVTIGTHATAGVTPQVDCTYAWSIDGGGTIYGSNTGPGVTFTPTGSATVTLTCAATNAHGTASASVTCSAVGAPTMPSVSVPALLPVGLTGAIATASNLAAGCTSTWRITGLTGSTNTQATFTAPAAGNYTVYCTSMNAAGMALTGTASFTTETNPLTTTPLTFTNVSTCLPWGGTGTASVVVDGAYASYTWGISNGVIQSTSGDTTSITFTAIAPGTVTLQCSANPMTGMSGTRGPTNCSVQASSATSSFSVTVPSYATLNQPFSVGLTGTPDATLTYTWSGSNATVNPSGGNHTGSASITPTQLGPLVLTITVQDCLSGGYARQMTVQVEPVPTITSFTPSSTNITPGGTVFMTAVFSAGAGGHAVVDQGVGGVASGVPIRTQAIEASTRFTLTVSNGAGATATEQALVFAGGQLETWAGTVNGYGELDGRGASAQFSNPTGLAYSATTGAMLVTDSGLGTIRQMGITSPYEVLTLAGQAGAPGNTDALGTAAQFNKPMSGAVDSVGNLYVADVGNNRIRKIAPSGAVSTFAPTYSFTSVRQVAVDGSNNLYVLDSGAGQVAMFEPNGSPSGFINVFPGPTAIAVTPGGSFWEASGSNNSIYYYAMSGGNLTNVYPFQSNFGQITAMAYDPGSGVGTDTLYLVEAGVHAVYSIADPITNWITQPTPAVLLAGTPGSQGIHDGLRYTGQFWSPTALALDGLGDLLVADANAIRSVNLLSGGITTVAGATGNPGTWTGTAPIQFNQPTGLAFGSGGSYDTCLYVANTGGYEVTYFTNPGSGAPLYTSFLKAGWSSSVSHPIIPAGVAADSNGNAYVSDPQNNVVWKWNGGEATIVAGLADNPGFNYGTPGQLVTPMGLAWDNNAHLLIADPGNQNVVALDCNTNDFSEPYLYVISGYYNGGPGYLSHPQGVAVDGAGHVYVADPGNYTIQMIASSGYNDYPVTTLIAGAPGQQGTADGLGTAARFTNPTAIASDAVGNLYVADGNLVRFINTAGQVTTILGEPGFFFNALGAVPAAMTQFTGVALSPNLPGWLFLTTQDAVLTLPVP